MCVTPPAISTLPTPSVFIRDSEIKPNRAPSGCIHASENPWENTPQSRRPCSVAARFTWPLVRRLLVRRPVGGCTAPAPAVTPAPVTAAQAPLPPLARSEVAPRGRPPRPSPRVRPLPARPPAGTGVASFCNTFLFLLRYRISRSILKLYLKKHSFLSLNTHFLPAVIARNSHPHLFTLCGLFLFVYRSINIGVSVGVVYSRVFPESFR